MRTGIYRRSTIFCGTLLLNFCCSGIAQAQENSLTIRVESSRVLVPVFLGYIPCHGQVCSWDGEAFSVQPGAFPDLIRLGLLPAASLRLFVDGKEQKIEAVETVPAGNGVRYDNLGAHIEWADVPQGIWSTSDQEPALFTHLGSGGSYYMISFSPPPSPEGSCHRIQIKAARHQSSLVYRHEYCNVRHSSSDPLRGTPEGRQLERYILSGKKGNIHLSAEANYIYVTPGKARVHIDMEFPFSDAPHRFDVLVIAHGKDRETVARRSDRSTVSRFGSEWYDQAIAFARLWVETRYDTQMELPPGEYTIAVAISHGNSFGVTEIPLTVPNYDVKQLSISSIVLCKRVRKAGSKPVAPEFVPLVSKGYEFTPAADTIIRKSDPLMAYFEVYEPSFSGPQPGSIVVNFKMKIISEATGAVALNTKMSAASFNKAGKSMIPVAVEPVLSKLKLAPGKYKLEIQASDSAGRKAPWRAAEFSIE